MTTTTTEQHFTVRHDGVTIAASRGGRGRPMVLCPGMCTTQAEMHELIGLLRRDHDVIAFDLRGHGRSSAADRYSFDGFRSDLDAVLAAVRRLDLPSEPVLVGYSLGADLVVHHASRHAGAAGLVLVDGANPVPEPIITEADLAEFRPIIAEQVARQQEVTDPARRVRLTTSEILDMDREIEDVRSGILERYRTIEGPIRMIMSTSLAGGIDADRAPRRNRTWRAGVARLVRAQPRIRVSWLDADHQLVFTHAPDVAALIGR